MEDSSTDASVRQMQLTKYLAKKPSKTASLSWPGRQGWQWDMHFSIVSCHSSLCISFWKTSVNLIPCAETCLAGACSDRGKGGAELGGSF